MKRTAAFLVAVLFMALSTIGLAQTGVLPAYGTVMIEVESVCSSADQPGRVSVRTATVSGNITSTSGYPFYVERLYDTVLVRSYLKSATEMYMVRSDWGPSCSHMTGSFGSDSNVVYWSLLRQLFTTVYATATGSVSKQVRGISVTESKAAAELTVPADLGGSAAPRAFDVVYLTNDPRWSMNYQQNVAGAPLSVTLTPVDNTGSAESCLFTISYFGTNVTTAEDLAIPKDCTGMNFDASVTPLATPVKRAAVQPVSAAALANPAAPPMPEFPPEFSANFQTVSPKDRYVRFTRNSFSIYDIFSYTTLQAYHPDSIGRVSRNEWYVTGHSQLSYFVNQVAMLDRRAVIDPKVQEYFFPDKTTCSRALMGYDEVADSVDSLMLVDRLVTPMFVGNRTARNIPCGVWSAPVNGARVTWYFASDTSFYETAVPTPEDSHMSGDDGSNSQGPYDEFVYSRLVRIVVEGTGGAAPFFLHHPYFAQGYAFPKADRLSACRALGPVAAWMECVWPGGGDFTFSYDVTAYVPYVPYLDTSVPAACINVTTSAAFPSASCGSQGGIPAGAAGILLILVAIIALLLGTCGIWCYSAPVIRGLEEDMIALVAELDKHLEPEAPSESGPADQEDHADAADAAEFK